MSGPLLIIGCGSFGREVLALVKALNLRGGGWEILGFVDDHPTPSDLERVALLRSRVIGNIDELRVRKQPVASVIGVGSPKARRLIADRLRGSAVNWAVLIHPDSTLGTEIRLGPGTVIAAGARLSTVITVGRHVHVDQNAKVGHDSSLGAFSRLNPQACVSGSVTIGEEALIGAHATVLPGLNVGDQATVGAGAVVVSSVPAGHVVKGVPAR